MTRPDEWDTWAKQIKAHDTLYKVEQSKEKVKCCMTGGLNLNLPGFDNSDS